MCFDTCFDNAMQGEEAGKNKVACMHIHEFQKCLWQLCITVLLRIAGSQRGFWNVVDSGHRLLVGSACRNLADNLAYPLFK